MDKKKKEVPQNVTERVIYSLSASGKLEKVDLNTIKK